MLSLKKIQAIALYEAKTLFRSWFFRIFLLISLLALLVINTGLFVLPNTSRWMYYGLSSCVPYLNILLLSIVQAIIGIFMASDFLKYDYKLDTTDVIYIRSMTNANYIFGKVFGILIVFISLNLVVLFIALIYNVFFVDVGIAWEAYFLYPLLLSIPSLMFIIGLTFLVMMLFRNQAVTFIALLGFSAIVIFFLSQKMNQLFDFTGFYLPFLFSDFIGFSNFSDILVQRSLYFLLGCGFIFTAVLFLKRLPQSRYMNRISLILLIVCFTGAGILGFIYVSKIENGRKFRSEILSLMNDMRQYPVVSVETCTIELIHSGKEIEALAEIRFSNKTSEEMENLIFSLNPGFKVSQVTYQDNDVSFIREIHVLKIQPDVPVKPGEMGVLTVKYGGKIDDRACYVEIDEEERSKSNRLSFYNIGKRHSFITPEYVLLTPVTNWYPIPGTEGGNLYSGSKRMDFINFNLKVRTNKNLRAISQGTVITESPGEYNFKSDAPFPGISVAIGKYESKSVMVDSIDYTVYYLNGHDYFTQYFDKLGESLKELISSNIAEYENKLEMNYPYKRLSLVETPIQFFAYHRTWTLSMETSLPEQILLPENGLSLTSGDFKQFSYFMSRRGRGGPGRAMPEITPEQLQEFLFMMFVNNTFLTTGSQTRGFGGFRRMGSSVATQALSSISIQESPADYSLFPLYYTHTRHFSSEKWPMFNLVMENYLSGKLKDIRSIFRGFFTGLSEQDRSNLSLMKYSLEEIMADPDLVDNFSETVNLKSTVLFSLIESGVDSRSFEQFMKDYLESIIFTDKPVVDFITAINERFGIQLESYLNSWMKEKNLPAFVMSDVESYEILDNDKTRYQILFDVSNIESVSGIIKVELMTRGGGMGGPGLRMGGGRNPFEPEGEKIIPLSGNQTKRIGLIVDNEPFMMTINTYTSKNLPSVITRNFGEIEHNEEIKPFDGAIVLDKPVNPTVQGTVVMDNEDSGFKVQSETSDASVLKLLNIINEEEEEYIGFRFRDLPKVWKPTTGGNYYGTYRLSAHYIRAGKGQNKVSWEAQIPESGSYDVYAYYPGFGRMFRGRGREGDLNNQSPVKDFHFFVHHDDGVEEITVDLSNADEGWVFLGSFYFSKGEATVELTDKSQGRIVYADAVKWVRRD